MPEPYTGAALGKLRNYRLANPDGTIRIANIGGADQPVIDSEVIDRFLALDPSKKKKLFDWMLFASGGGEPHKETSRRALEMVEKMFKDQLMQGEEGAPMTEEQAEAAWEQVKDEYEAEYMFSDEDLASDRDYPLFGWFRKWPGRNNVYQKIVQAVEGLNRIAGDKKLLQKYNQLFPNAPFETDLTKYASVDDLLRVVGEFKRKMAQRKAEKNVQYLGKAGAKGPTEKLYSDEVMDVVIPATAAASMASGFPNWCISNASTFKSYFSEPGHGQRYLHWGSYCQNGPFVFWNFKPDLENQMLQKLAAQVKLEEHPDGKIDVEKLAFWDGNNRVTLSYKEVADALEQEIPGSKANFDASIEAVKEWFQQFDLADIEKYPALESLRIRRHARALAEAVLSGKG